MDTPMKPISSVANTPDGVRAGERGNRTGFAQIDISKLSIKLTDAPKSLPDFKTFKFGTLFSDHMATASFNPISGWSCPEIKPYAPITLDPASSCFQYCDNVFEGMKAYLGPDGNVRLFRPDMNMRRLERSMARLALPPIDGDTVLELIKRFVQIERRWILTDPGYSLYLRPTVIGTRAALGVGPADHALLYILASPSGPFFERPISLLAVTDAVRAWPGGTGGHKCGGNYSPAFVAQREAAERGYDQVLWLFGEERRVTEGGAMNMFVVLRRADGDGWDVVTPPLDGTILPGVTRASCLALAANPVFHASIKLSTSSALGGHGVTKLHAVERTFTMYDLARWSADGTLLEVMCVGTASIVAAVHRIGFEGRDMLVRPRPSSSAAYTGDLPLLAGTDENGLGPVGRALRAKILAVQLGREEYDGWGVVVPPAYNGYSTGSPGSLPVPPAVTATVSDHGDEKWRSVPPGPFQNVKSELNGIIGSGDSTSQALGIKKLVCKL